ncbi:unnamed protein product, partial [Timema podura]|nr:unnamed protein product [Timema podura]
MHSLRVFQDIFNCMTLPQSSISTPEVRAKEALIVSASEKGLPRTTIYPVAISTIIMPRKCGTTPHYHRKVKPDATVSIHNTTEMSRPRSVYTSENEMLVVQSSAASSKKSTRKAYMELEVSGRVEDDGSAVVSLAGTDVGWTRVSQAGVGTGHSPPTPAGSSDENLSVLLNAPISRSVPAPFQKEVLARCFVTSRPQDGHFIDEILNDGISEERLVYILGQSLPRIIPNVILNKREV